LSTGFKPLRYVADHVDVFDKSDHNDHVDNWKAELDLLRSQNVALPEVDQLAQLVASMRYVKNYGETSDLTECYYTADDHNRFVQAFQLLLAIFQKQGVKGDAMDAFTNIVKSMEQIPQGRFYWARYHNLFADAWRYVIMLNGMMAPAQVYVFNTDDWASMEPYITDGAVIVMNPTISTVTPDRILSVLQSKQVKLMVLIDTQPYYPKPVPALKGVLYSVDKYTLSHYTDTFYLISPADKEYFGVESVPALYDSDTYRGDHVSQAVEWGVFPLFPDWGAFYVKIGNSYVIEVPCDGFWKDVSWLEKYLYWIPGGYPQLFPLKRVLHIASDGTDRPDWHQYPTLSQTLQAWAQQHGYAYSDLR